MVLTAITPVHRVDPISALDYHFLSTVRRVGRKLPEIRRRILENVVDRRDKDTPRHVPGPAGEFMKLAESLACYITQEGNLEHEQDEEGEPPNRPWIPIFDSTRGESEHATREALRRRLWKQLSERCSSERIVEWRRLRLEKGIPILAAQEPPSVGKTCGT